MKCQRTTQAGSRHGSTGMYDMSILHVCCFFFCCFSLDDRYICQEGISQYPNPIYIYIVAGFGIPQRPRFASDGSATGTSDAMLRSTKLGMSLDDLLFTSADLNGTDDVTLRGGIEDDNLGSTDASAGGNNRSKSRLGDAKKKAAGKSTVNLSLHGAIGAGWLTSVDVGGGGWNSLGLVDSMDEPGEVSAGTFLCGSVIRQLAVAHNLSGDHECMLSKEAKQLVGNGNSATVWTEERMQEEESGGDREGEIITRVAYKLISVHTDAVLNFKHVLSTQNSYRIDALLEGLSFEQRLLAKDALEKYVPDSLLERLQAGQAGWLGELRPVSIAFVNFDVKALNDHSPTDDKAKKAKGPLFRALEELERAIIIAFQLTLSAGAFIRQFTMDEKGLVLIYCCGLPGGRVIDSKHQQAVSLGVSLHRRLLEELNHKVGIGIASGRVCCGFVGQQGLRCEYSLVGDTVNLAARLAGRAKKTGEGVVCCSSTIEPLHAEPFRLRGLNIESGGSMRPKGKTYHVEVFVVKSSVASTDDHVRMSSFSISVGVGGHYRKFSSTSSIGDMFEYSRLGGERENYCLPSEPLLEREEPLLKAVACIKSILDPAVDRREYEKDKAIALAAAQIRQQQVHHNSPCCSAERKTGDENSLQIPQPCDSSEYMAASALTVSSLLSAGVIRPPNLCTPMSQQSGGTLAYAGGGGGGRGGFFSSENNRLSGKWLVSSGNGGGGGVLHNIQQSQSTITHPPLSTAAATIGARGGFWPPLETMLTPVAGTSNHSAVVIASPRSQRAGRPTEKQSNNMTDSRNGLLQQLSSVGSATGPHSPTDDEFHRKQFPSSAFCCIIEGEAGMGKTALLQWLCDRILLLPPNCKGSSETLGSSSSTTAVVTSSVITPSPVNSSSHNNSETQRVHSYGSSNGGKGAVSSCDMNVGNLSLSGVERLEILSVCGLEMEQATPYAMLGRLITQVIKLALADDDERTTTNDDSHHDNKIPNDDSAIDAVALTRILPRHLWTSILQLVNMCIPLCNMDFLLELQAQEFQGHVYGRGIPEPPIFHKKEKTGPQKILNVNSRKEIGGGGGFFQNSLPAEKSTSTTTVRSSFSIIAHKRDVQVQQQHHQAHNVSGGNSSIGATDNDSLQLREISELCCALLQAAVRNGTGGGGAAAAATSSNDASTTEAAVALLCRPIAIVLDDLHFVDGWSLDVLLCLVKATYEEDIRQEGIIREKKESQQNNSHEMDGQQPPPFHGGELKLMGRVCFITTGRPELSMPSDIRQTYRHLLSLPTCFRVELRPLTGHATASLAEHVLGSKGLSSSPGLADSVSQTCGGNPFFVKELCGAIAKTSSSANASTSAQLVPSAILEGNFFQQEISLPASVQNFSVAKVDALGAKLSLVLKVAAVLGERFTGDLLAKVFTESFGLERCNLEACLQELCDGPGRILHRKPGTENCPPLSNDAEYRFSSILVLHTTYSMQLHSYRRRLHCRTAMEVQRRRGTEMGGGEDDDACLLAATHWLRVLRDNELGDDDVKHCVKILQIPDDGHTHARLWTMGMEAIAQGIVRLRRKGLLDASGTLAKQALHMMGVMETSVCQPLEVNNTSLDDTSILSPLSSPMGAMSNVGILQAGSGLCSSQRCRTNYDRSGGGGGAQRGGVSTIFSQQQPQSMSPTTALNQRKASRAGTGTGWQQRDVAEFSLLMECSTTMRFLEDGSESVIMVLAQRASCLLLMSCCSCLPLRDRLRCSMFVSECHLEAGRTGAALASLESMYEHVSESGPSDHNSTGISVGSSDVFPRESFPTEAAAKVGNNANASSATNQLGDSMTVPSTVENGNGSAVLHHPHSNYLLQESVLLRLEILAPMALEAMMRGNLEEADNLSSIASVWIEHGSPAPYCLSVLDPVVLLLGVRMFIGANNLDPEEYILYCRALGSYLTGETEGSGGSGGGGSGGGTHQLSQPLQAHCSLVYLSMLWMGTFHLTELFWLVRFMDTIMYKTRHPRLTAIEAVARQVCLLMKLQQEVQIEMSEKNSNPNYSGPNNIVCSNGGGIGDDGGGGGEQQHQRVSDMMGTTSKEMMCEKVDARIVNASQELMDNIMRLSPGDRVMSFPAVAFALINVGYTDLSYQALRLWRSDMSNGAAGGNTNGALLSWLAMADGGNLLRQAYTTARSFTSTTTPASAAASALNSSNISNNSNYYSGGGGYDSHSKNSPSVIAMHQREHGLERIRMGLDIARQRNIALAESWAQSELDLWEAYPLPIPLPSMCEVDNEESEEEFGAVTKSTTATTEIIETVAGVNDTITTIEEVERVGDGLLRQYSYSEEEEDDEGEIISSCSSSPSAGNVRSSSNSIYHLLSEEQPDVKLSPYNTPVGTSHQQYGLNAALDSIKGAKKAISKYSVSLSPLPSAPVSGSSSIISHMKVQHQRRSSNRQVSFKGIGDHYDKMPNSNNSPLRSISVHNAANVCGNIVHQEVNSNAKRNRTREFEYPINSALNLPE